MDILGNHSSKRERERETLAEAAPASACQLSLAVRIGKRREVAIRLVTFVTSEIVTPTLWLSRLDFVGSDLTHMRYSVRSTLIALLA
jgi:hypothetical protein